MADRAKPVGDVAVPAYRARDRSQAGGDALVGGSVGSWLAMAGVSIGKERG